MNQATLPADRSRMLSLLALLATFPLLGGARGGCGDGPVSSRSPAPDVSGAWAITYDDSLAVKVTLGGAVYETTVGAQGGQITIDHNGQPFTFDLACERPEVVCPTEVWPETVTLTQRNAEFPHRMFLTLPRQTCRGVLVPAVPAECGAGTTNPNCDEVCDGELTVANTEHFGVIDEPGRKFDILLGAGVASNGLNCALLGVSAAHGELVTTGTAAAGNWRATAMDNGTVKTAYAGGCLWVGDPDDDGTLEALVITAGVEFTTGYTGARR